MAQICIYVCMWVCMWLFMPHFREAHAHAIYLQTKSWFNCTNLGLKVFAEHMLSGGRQCISFSVVESSSPSLFCG